MSASPNAKPADDRDIITTRVVNAPRDLVFKAWSSAEHLANWWGPNGFSTTTSKMEFKPGGEWRFVMHGPDGRDYKNLITYVDIRVPELISYRHGDDQPDGGAPIRFETLVTFEVQGAKTLVTLRARFESKAERDRVAKLYGAEEGGRQTLGRLAAFAEETLSNVTPFTIARTFDAPRDLVWTMHTEARHLERWWGPKGCKLSVERLEFRPGGLFHYAMRYSTGAEMWGRFFYRELDPPTRMVYFSSFANAKGGIARAPFGPVPYELQNTVTLTEKDGRTTLSIHTLPFGADGDEIAFFDQLRDTNSLAQGFGGTLDQLAAYLLEVRNAH